jgi:hypothetical protein
MIPGAPLSWLWDHQDGGFKRAPYGASQHAFKEYSWDFISFQPFDRHLEGEQGDRALIRRYLDLTPKGQVPAKIIIYAQWPRMRIEGKALNFDKHDFDPSKPAAEQVDLSTIDDFGDLWDIPYQGRKSSNGAIDARDYYKQLAHAVREDHPERDILVAPVGEVMYRLHQKMKAGQISGYSTAWQLYKDQIHLNPTGCYVAGCTYFALITGTSPIGLPHEPYGQVDTDLVPVIQKTVAEVVLGKKSTAPKDTF